MRNMSSLLEIEPGSLHKGGDTQTVHHEGVAHRCLHVPQKPAISRACRPINLLLSAHDALERLPSRVDGLQL